MPSPTSNPHWRTKLRRILAERFNDSELNTFCFDLGIDYEQLRGDTKDDKARELVAYVGRYRLMEKLLRIGKRDRNDIPWDDLLLCITIDTTVLINAFQEHLDDEWYFVATVKDYAEDLAVEICLDTDGRMKSEYQRQLSGQALESFRKWLIEIEPCLEGYDGQLAPEHALGLTNCGCEDAMDRVVIAVAHQSGKILVTEEENTGKGSAHGSACATHPVLSYLQGTMGLRVHNSAEARRLVRKEAIRL